LCFLKSNFCCFTFSYYTYFPVESSATDCLQKKIKREEEGLLTCTAFSDAASVGHFDKQQQQQQEKEKEEEAGKGSKFLFLFLMMMMMT